MKKLICMLLALVMVLSMVACGDENKEAYEQAVAAYNNGYYEDAANQLAALGDYKDASTLLATISAQKQGATVTVTTADGTVETNVEYVLQNGNVIKEISTYADGTVTKNYYKYNDDNSCSNQTMNDTEGGKTVINHFYMNGVKVRTLRTNPDKSKDTYEYTCDETGKVTSHILTLADNSVEEATYSYNEQGLVSVISTATGTTTYEYNAFGDLTKKAVAVNGEVVQATTYAYVYTFIVAK